MIVIETNKIRKEFGALVAINDVSLTVEKGQVLGLIGPNGAGKTTLLRILATLLRPTDGSAEILGHNLTKRYLDIRKHIGFMPDFFNLYNDLKLDECLEFFAKAYKVDAKLIPQKIDDTLEYVDLTHKREDYIRHLSRGMVQRMGVATLLVHDPEILLLDEPASGLDPKARIKLRQILKRRSTEGKTIIISSHILTELSGFCSHVAIMNDGKIEVVGDVDQVSNDIITSAKMVISVLDKCDEAVNLIKEYPDTKLLAVDDHTITVETKREPEQLADLNAHLIKNNIRVTSFYEEKADLEDVFMKISSD